MHRCLMGFYSLLPSYGGGHPVVQTPSRQMRLRRLGKAERSVFLSNGSGICASNNFIRVETGKYDLFE